MAGFICPRCRKAAGREGFERNLRVCDNCGYHARLNWEERLRFILDEDSFVEFDSDLGSKNPLEFPGYEAKLAESQRAAGLKEGVVTGRGAILGYPLIIGIMDSTFMMGSMGSVVGEKIARAFEYGTAHTLPVIMFTASGGARMQEGIFSLMQMAKTGAAAALHNQAGQLYISVLTDPTTGGVTASFASLGDIIIAEPGALIGFAGARVIQDTIGQALPPGFQSAEFVCAHGFADMIVPRGNLRGVLARLIRVHGYKNERARCLP
ncbi:MAG: acetyl-CoA carboxylase, carboxyltransferase subunit beta [Treponema sp.]|jgi:acetyl-CoA carboxylase carboxyl transferase subunit beta|nr:acetyl-CoA carboxylase, carboxyltransferase subunit beta [Treponema sp.]